MTLKKQQVSYLENSKEKIESVLESSSIRICGTKLLRTFLKNSESLDFIFAVTRITADDLIMFLIDKSHLKKVKFLTPREETLYLCNTFATYAVESG